MEASVNIKNDRTRANRHRFSRATIKVPPCKMKPSHVRVGRFTPEPGAGRTHVKTERFGYTRKCPSKASWSHDVASGGSRVRGRGVTCGEVDHVIPTKGPRHSGTPDNVAHRTQGSPCPPPAPRGQHAPGGRRVKGGKSEHGETERRAGGRQAETCFREEGG